MSARHPSWTSIAVLCLAAGGLPTPALAAAPSGSAEAIIERANAIYDGHDSRSRLSFRVSRPGGKTKRLDFVMLWKRYEAGPVEEKTILFQTFPPSRQGIAYMNWSYRDAERPDAAWLYLPELRTIRKVVHGSHHHHHKKTGPFSLSLIQRAQLLERPASADRLRRLDDGHRDGRTYLRIERIPRMRMDDSPYARIVDWIEPASGRIERIEYFDDRDRLVLEQAIEWQTLGRAQVWRRVLARNPTNGARTELLIDDTRIDQGLTDRYFSKRRMRLGPP